MTRFHKITIGIFCSGVLLTGSGAGVAFGEFSSLAYGGTEVVGETNMVTRDISREIDPEQGVWNIDGYWDTAPEVEADESIPENTVLFRITYNQAMVEPRIEETVQEDEYYDNDADTWRQTRTPALELHCYWENTDESDFQNLMEAKDKVLAGLKRGELISVVGAPHIEQVQIFYNPVNEKDLRL
ncbi:hypothetical protein H8S44_10970 [Anaerosacchariphilus sp. NSJ-68]|uniref:Uncharacterized protein n=2 Tax=Lachnospiraceae TaxID=186803 RepID=A0A923RMH8_9FIRM|nr:MULTISPECIES: hypothetical protein [Lachnospiraceae]MBC5660294.1 hypothetical protein [Anaerosacchariphilus hominis]MBC5697858.1 hypothetical protein [Roseburia difficilis]